jgi:hypothetical protein
MGEPVLRIFHHPNPFPQAEARQVGSVQVVLIPGRPIPQKRQCPVPERICDRGPVSFIILPPPHVPGARHRPLSSSSSQSSSSSTCARHRPHHSLRPASARPKSDDFARALNSRRFGGEDDSEWSCRPPPDRPWTTSRGSITMLRTSESIAGRRHANSVWPVVMASGNREVPSPPAQFADPPR